MCQSFRFSVTKGTFIFNIWKFWEIQISCIDIVQNLDLYFFNFIINKEFVNQKPCSLPFNICEDVPESFSSWSVFSFSIKCVVYVFVVAFRIYNVSTTHHQKGFYSQNFLKLKMTSLAGTDHWVYEGNLNHWCLNSWWRHLSHVSGRSYWTYTRKWGEHSLTTTESLSSLSLMYFCVFAGL